MVQCTYLQSRNADADIENGLMDVAWEGNTGTKWQSSSDILTYMLP